MSILSLILSISLVHVFSDFMGISALALSYLVKGRVELYETTDVLRKVRESKVDSDSEK